jgi:hypothetical protein
LTGHQIGIEMVSQERWKKGAGSIDERRVHVEEENYTLNNTILIIMKEPKIRSDDLHFNLLRLIYLLNSLRANPETFFRPYTHPAPLILPHLRVNHTTPSPFPHPTFPLYNELFASTSKLTLGTSGTKFVPVPIILFPEVSFAFAHAASKSIW